MSSMNKMAFHGSLALFAAIVAVSHGQFVAGKACPAAIPLDVVETFSSGDPLTGLAKSNPAKLLAQQQRSACLNEASLALVNEIRAAFTAAMSPSEAARRKASKTEVGPLSLGPKYLQAEALNHSVVMSAASNTLNQKIAALNAARKCSTFITGETIGVAQLPNPPPGGANPSVETCIRTMNTSASHRTVLLQDFHQEAVAGVYVDPRNLVWCTITFSARTRNVAGTDCAPSKWELPKPTPSVSPKPSVSAKAKAATVAGASVSGASVSGASASTGAALQGAAATLAKNSNISVPTNLKAHTFRNKRFAYKLVDGKTEAFELRCQGTACRFCTVKGTEFWCFSEFFSVFFDLYVTKKTSTA